MPKKKKRKEVKKDNNAWIEVKGILLILITVIGLCKFKPLSNIINGFAGFLVGVWWGVLLLLVGIIGGYMIVKRSKPDLLTSHFIGLYVIIIGLLALSHVGYIDKNITKSLEEGQSLSYSVVFEETFNNLNNFIDGSLDIQGGGVIGALFGVTLVKLLSITGANVVSIVLMVCGFIMFTGITLYDIAKTLKKGVKKTVELKNKAKIKEEVKKVEDFFEKDNKPVVSTDVQDKEEKDNRVIISSVDELIKDEEIKPDFNDEDIEILDVKDYSFPPITLLKKNTKNNSKENQELVKNTIPVLQEVFKDFGIDAKVVAVNIGPSVTQYEMEVKAGTKLSKVISLDRELALALAAKSVHIQAPIPGKKTIGIETPNKVNTMVSVRELLEAIPKSLSDSKLLVTLGKDILGKPVFCEINKTPHLLVAGATGSGKSVCINSMLVSILMRTKPDEVKLVLVDPKKVELSIYNGVPHLLTPVVTDPRKANIVLKKIVAEMDRRYDLFEQSGTKNIAGYNTYIDKKNKTKDEYGQIKKIPYIVVIIDELADLMLVAAKEVEDSIMRITQMARAAGIHLIVATQRPSTDVITGVVKANIPARISFSVSSSIDSRTILDMTGAEKLLGKGDMLFLPQGENIPLRVQGTFISDDEIKSVVDYTIAQQKVHYDVSMENNEVGTTTGVEMDATEEPLYNDIVEFVVTQGKASASLLQRRFKIGYNRAARAIDILEERGIVGPSNGSKPREVLFKVENKE